MDIFNAVAEPNRRRILEMLASKGKLSAKDISEEFDMSFPAISQHLKVLRESGLVNMEKSAQKRIYQINPNKMLELENWAQKLKAIWTKRYDALERLLESQKDKNNVKTKSRNK